MSILSMLFLRLGNRAGLEANLILNQDFENQVCAESLDLFQVGNQEIKFGAWVLAVPNRRRAFDKCAVLEIKDSALFLAFAFQDIKDIKRRRRVPRSASRVGGTPTRLSACLRSALAVRHFKNSPIELKEGQNLRCGNSLRKCGTDEPFRCFSPNAARGTLQNSPNELKETRNV